MEKKYHINYKEFSLIYLIYPLVFLGVLYDSEQSLQEYFSFAIFMTLVAVLVTHLFFKKVLYEKAVIILGDEGVTSFSLSGEKEYIAFSDMTEPKEDNILMLKRMSIQSRQDPLLKIVITGLTDNSQELLDGIRKGIAAIGRKD